MFTGIVQATAVIAAIEDRAGLRTFSIEFPPGFCADLAIGASVATDGVCLTVTEILSPTSARFDVMQQSLAITTLGPAATFDAAWGGAIEAPLRAAAEQLSRDLGHAATPG